MCFVASIPLPISLHDPVANTWGLTLGMSGLKTRERVSLPAWPWVAPKPTPAVHVLRDEHAGEYSTVVEESGSSDLHTFAPPGDRDEVCMLVFGHIGLTLGVARALSREIDARWVAVASLLPDLIDKPLRYVLAPVFTQGNTRTVGHSLTVLLVGMVLLAFPLRRIIRGARVVALVLPV